MRKDLMADKHPMYNPEAILPEAVPDLIGLIRINRAGLEDRLANQHARFRAEMKRADEAETANMKAHEKMLRAVPHVLKLIAVARKDHLKCVGKAGEGLMGKCAVCDAIAEVKEWMNLS